MKNIKSDPSKTVLTIATGFLIIYLLTEQIWWLYFALLIGTTGIFSNFMCKKIDYLWMKLAWLLGLIIPRIVLTLVFYLILFPISALSKIFRKTDFLILKPRNSSVLTETKKQFSPASFNNPW